MRCCALLLTVVALGLVACDFGGSIRARPTSTAAATTTITEEPSPTPRTSRSRAQEAEADADPSLPGEYVDLPTIYNGYYGNRDGANTAAHVTRSVDYSVQGLPPAGGPHWGLGACGLTPAVSAPFCGPVQWGIYGQPWPAESLVHNMEHAGVIIWYNTSDEAVIGELEAFATEQLNSNVLLVLAPYPDMEAETMAITVWSRRDRFPVSEYDPERLQHFIDVLYCRFDPEGFCRDMPTPIETPIPGRVLRPD